MCFTYVLYTRPRFFPFFARFCSSKTGPLFGPNMVPPNGFVMSHPFMCRWGGREGVRWLQLGRRFFSIFSFFRKKSLLCSVGEMPNNVLANKLRALEIRANKSGRLPEVRNKFTSLTPMVADNPFVVEKPKAIPVHELTEKVYKKRWR